MRFDGIVEARGGELRCGSESREGIKNVGVAGVGISYV